MIRSLSSPIRRAAFKNVGFSSLVSRQGVLMATGGRLCDRWCSSSSNNRFSPPPNYSQSIKVINSIYHNRGGNNNPTNTSLNSTKSSDIDDRIDNGSNNNNNDSNSTGGGAVSERRSLWRIIVILGVAAYIVSFVNLKPGADGVERCLLVLLPLRSISYLWGFIHHLTLPKFLRSPLYSFWTWAFDCNLDEIVEKDLSSYRNLAEFFSRPIDIRRCRTVDEKADLVSPVDGRLVMYGKVTKGDEQSMNNFMLEQIKGKSFSLSHFLGFDYKPTKKESELYYAIIYLAPGDYHRIHSATNCRIDKRVHVPGHCLPVAPPMLNAIPALFARNERVIVTGQWKGGFFALSPVAATNVGNIILVDEPELRTNDPFDKIGEADERIYRRPFLWKKGDEIARFDLGSTVVLFFESKEGKPFRFTLDPSIIENKGKIKVGQAIGSIEK